MRNREHISKWVDSIMAVLQTLILSLIPIFIKDNPVQKTVSYIIITIVIIVYITVFRNKLIKMIILQQGIDTDYIKNKILIPLFNGDLLPKVRSIANLDKTLDKFELNYRFLIWNEATTFIINYFWDSGKLINVVTEKTTSFSS